MVTDKRKEKKYFGKRWKKKNLENNRKQEKDTTAHACKYVPPSAVEKKEAEAGKKETKRTKARNALSQDFWDE